ncbi:MAG: Chitin binding protein [Herbinix sp.]|nr:Chitin binding protein [Herbinix sp.]
MNKRNYYSKISIILIVCMGISIFNPIENVKAATWTDPGTNIVWTYVASGSTNATKVYTSTTGLSGTVTVPSTINGLTVTSVGYGTSVYKLINNAAARANVTEVILPETVTTIEGYAFADHTGLTKITIPKNVTTLGGYAFQNCTALEEWTINAKNLSSIATTVLSGVTKLKTINIGEDVESINIYNLLRAYAAQNITLNFNAINYTDANKISPTIVNSVKILNIGPNVGKFSSNIYSGLNGLQEINYNATNATTLSASTYGLSNNTKVYIGENVINVPAYSFSSNNTTYYMLNKNTTLEENAITNPWSGTIYGWYNTPAHDYAIANGFFTFTDYDSYGTATENGIEWYYEKGEDDTLAIKPNLGGSSLSGDIIVPESLNGKMVAKISNNAFENANITNITLPNTITDIGDSAFASSTLSSLTLPTSVTNIGNSSFAYMNNIEEITIPEGVVILGENTFNASSLKRINLPSSLIQIGDNSLSNLSYLEEINIDEGNTAFKSIDGILYNKDMTQLLLFPKENAKTTYTIPNTITTLYANFLNGNSPLIQSNNLTELIIPKNVTAIGKDYNSAIDFYSSSKDIKVTILNKDVVISDYSIGGNSLTLSSYSPSTTKSYAASNYITFVEYKEVLYPYTILHKYNGVINEALTETGQATEGTVIDTFKNNEDASNVLVSTENYPLIISKNDNTMIINYESTGLAWKAVQKSLGGETGFYAYPVNANLASGDIVVPTEVEGNTIIGVGGFEGNTQILSVNIPEGIKYIFTDAFRGCENLTTVNLPSTIEYLGSFSFEGCENLNQINYSTIGNTYIQIGFGPFWNTNFTNFVIPENVNFSSAGIQSHF